MTTRRTVAALATVVLALLTACTGGGGESGPSEVVATSAGTVSGSTGDGVAQYLGIPYGQANERFVPAVEADPWDGTLKATQYGPICPQASILGMSSESDPDATDNCQNLNVWTPGLVDADDSGGRPVMVWLHGGGFSMGSANEPLYDGTNLAGEQDVVVVGVNHRLNVFGHLDLSEFGEKYAQSANVGILDIQLALEWIQENISQFGGDPTNVTIFGESGGGAKVLALMTTPQAQGLFTRAIVQSGATDTMGLTFASKEASLALSENILDRLGISAETIEDVQTVPIDELQEASAQARRETGEQFQIPAPLSDSYGMEWGPVVDGDYLPSNPVTEDGFAEAGRDVELLIGTNLNEWSMWRPDTAHDDMTPEQIAAFESAYPMLSAEDAPNVDTFLRIPALTIMNSKADQGSAGVYAYVFTAGARSDGANHGDEIGYVFGNIEDPLADAMSTAWASFARDGIPAAPQLPEWDPYTSSDGATMLLDETSTLVRGHDAELMRLMATAGG